MAHGLGLAKRSETDPCERPSTCSPNWRWDIEFKQRKSLICKWKIEKKIFFKVLYYTVRLKQSSNTGKLLVLRYLQYPTLNNVQAPPALWMPFHYDISKRIKPAQNSQDNLIAEANWHLLLIHKEMMMMTTTTIYSRFPLLQATKGIMKWCFVNLSMWKLSKLKCYPELFTENSLEEYDHDMTQRKAT